MNPTIAPHLRLGQPQHTGTRHLARKILSLWQRYLLIAVPTAFLAVVYAILAVILVVVLYPMIYILSCSFSSADDVQAGHVWLWPVHPTLLGYHAVFQNDLVLKSFFNSVFYTLFGAVFSTIMMAYPLSRKYFIGRRIWLLLFAFIFNGGLFAQRYFVKGVMLGSLKE